MKSKRIGFTLVELLVVIAIIGILVGLLLPAVQAAREAARRMECSNNLKNLALAAHNYHDTYKALPPGYVRHTGMTTSTDDSKWTWGAMILPFVEQQPLYDALEVGTLWIGQAAADTSAGGKLELMQTPLATFKCPSDVAPDLNSAGDRKIYEGPANSGTQRTLASANYVGVHSIGWREEGGVRGRQGVFQLLDRASNAGAVRFRDVIDGTSNTALLGERRWQYKQSGTNNFRITGAATALGIRGNTSVQSIAGALGTGLARINYNDSNNVARRRSNFSSMHPGGAQFALVDASVRFFGETIEFSDSDGDQDNDSTGNVNSLYERILARDDGQVVQIP